MDSSAISPVVGWSSVVRLGRRAEADPESQVLSWSDTESLLVSKRGASRAVAVQVRPGLSSLECMATENQEKRVPLVHQEAPSNCTARRGVACEPTSLKEIDGASVQA